MLQIYITKKVDKTTFSRLRAIGLAYDVQLLKRYKRCSEMFVSPKETEESVLAIAAFKLFFRGFLLFQEITESKLGNENAI
jgi:hypothetical protein